MKNYFKINEVIEHAIDKLNDGIGLDVYSCDLHNELFNQDYFIIGSYKAQQWLADNVFNVINIIKDYEQDNFGQVSTDFSEPEKVVNMYVYIVGESILSESKTLSDNWDNKLTQENIDTIIKELESIKQ